MRAEMKRYSHKVQYAGLTGERNLFRGTRGKTCLGEDLNMHVCMLRELTLGGRHVM